MTTRHDLANLKSRALRMRVWFRALSRIERAIVDLTIKCVEKIRSNVLESTISTIVGKILQFLEEGFTARAEKVGHEIVGRLCAIAERWGNKACSTWKNDTCFVKFLGINALNT